MLTSLTIQNFQSHKKSTLDFHPGINVIIGPSDCGKSAILRALRWLMEGKSAGDAYISHWAGKEATSAALTTDEHTITRTRAKGQPALFYEVDGVEYKACGPTWPETLSKYLAIDQETCVQWQHDSPFLLSLPAGQVAQALNRSVNLDAIDKALEVINGMARKVEADTRANATSLEATETSLSKYTGLDQLAGEIEVLVTTERRLVKQRGEVAVLELLMTDIVRVEDRISVLSAKVSALHLVRAEKYLVSLTERVVQATSLEELAQGIAQRDASLKTASRRLALLADLSPVLEWDGAREQGETEAEKLEALISTTTSRWARFKATHKELVDVEAQLVELMPDNCPLCGQVVDHG